MDDGVGRIFHVARAGAVGVRDIDAVGCTGTFLEAGQESGLPGEGEVAGIAVGEAFDLEDVLRGGLETGAVVDGAVYGRGWAEHAAWADRCGRGSCGCSVGRGGRGWCGGGCLDGAPDSLVAEAGTDFAFEVAGTRGTG